MGPFERRAAILGRRGVKRVLRGRSVRPSTPAKIPTPDGAPFEAPLPLFKPTFFQIAIGQKIFGDFRIVKVKER